ncbi:MAG TPA: hypothetical protein VFL34_13920 [Candidatus Sulfotelmatobacter sp.]|nr:hypothetical protein [Candidatus Sulfotelmatobacter sp.]
MHLSRRRLLFALLLFSIFVFAKAKDFVMPKAYPAKTYPAHDEHAAEKLTIAADPYDMPDKAAIFTIKYREQGYLPVFMVFTNDGETPVSMNDMKVELITHNRDKIQAASEDDLYRRFSHLKKRGDEPSRNPLPIPLPRGGPKAGVNKNQRDELSTALFAAKAVAPHESEAGFVFFDVSDISQPLAGARIYITGVLNANGQELMYFEIPMEKYLSYTPPGSSKP